MAQGVFGPCNLALASAVLPLIDRMSSTERPAGPVELATAMRIDAFLKVQEYLKLGGVRLQSILVTNRAWSAAKANPHCSVHLAIRERDIDHELNGHEDDA